MRKSPNIKPRTCQLCGKEYKPNGNTQKFCTECSATREKQRKKDWYITKYGYNPKTKCTEPCCICGGEFASHYDGKPYCAKHYSQLYRNGAIGEKSRNTNTFTIKGSVLEIRTSKGDLILADTSDYEKLKKYSWCISKTGYAVANIEGRTTKMHRYIMSLINPDEVIDHKNHNKLDNRKSNLRVCTVKENAVNQKSNADKPIGIRLTGTGKYRARIFVEGKEISLGCFNTLPEAISARQAAEIKYRGEFAQHLN